MAKNTSPDCKQCRREGMKLFLKGERCLTKCAFDKRPVVPGQHGTARKKFSEYGMQLREKQKVHTFDLKTFVNEKREAKREESMNKLISQVMPNMNRNVGLPGMNSTNRAKKPMSMEDMLKNIDKAVERLEKEEAQKKANINGNRTSVGKIDPIKVPSSMANDSNIDPLKVTGHKEVKKDVKTFKPVNNEVDFAAKITNKVNKTVKDKEHNSENITKSVNNKVIDNKIETKSVNDDKYGSDYVTDDQFFDDFFADDDD